MVVRLLATLGCGYVAALLLALAGELPIELIILPTALIVTVMLYRLFILPRRIKRLFAQQRELAAPFELEVSEEGFKFTTDFGERSRPWKKVLNWQEGSDLLVLYHSDEMLTVLPKRIFDDTDQVQRIKQYLEQNQIQRGGGWRGSLLLILFLLIIIAVTMQLRHSAQ